MLLLIVGLGGIQGDGGHGAGGPADLAVAESEGGVVELGSPAAQGLENLAAGGQHPARRRVNQRYVLRPVLSDHGEFAARNDHALPVNDPNRALRVLLQL